MAVGGIRGEGEVGEIVNTEGGRIESGQQVGKVEGEERMRVSSHG